MPKPFNVDAERNHFALPPLTRRQIQALIETSGDARTVVIEAVHLLARLRQSPQIKALILDLDMDLGDVALLAIAQLWQREIGEPERDVWEEIDAIKSFLRMPGEPAEEARMPDAEELRQTEAGLRELLDWRRNDDACAPTGAPTYDEIAGWAAAIGLTFAHIEMPDSPAEE